jgi:chorismate mutase
MYAIRGAISVAQDVASDIQAAGEELIRALLERNEIAPAQVVSAYFTSTPDLVAGFPATGARRAGFQQVPMLCAQEVPVPTAPHRIVRVMLHVEGTPAKPVQHVYLGEAAALRPDWASPS